MLKQPSIQMQICNSPLNRRVAKTPAVSSQPLKYQRKKNEHKSSLFCTETSDSNTATDQPSPVETVVQPILPHPEILVKPQNFYPKFL